MLPVVENHVFQSILLNLQCIFFDLGNLVSRFYGYQAYYNLLERNVPKPCGGQVTHLEKRSH